MSALSVKSVMVDLAAAVQPELDGGRTAHPRPVEALQPGDAVVGYPTDPMSISTTFRRGQDRATFPVFVICGMPQDESTQTAVDALVGSGSIVAAIEAYAGTWQSVSVTQASIVEYTPTGGSPMVALRFDVDVIA